MSDGKTSIPIRIVAFADDTTICASSHKGYLERMSLAGEYFGIFGVNFSPTKTNYTYANTGDRHYKSAPITVRHPDGSTTIQPSSITSPHVPLRYLGAWLSPTLNWKPAKRKLHDEVDRVLTILRYKSLTPSEYIYTIQSVLHAKLRYYLAVVPLTDKELDAIDARIAQVLKTRMHMATSVSSPLLFLPETEYGANLPSIRDTRAKANIMAAHALLNDNDSTLGKMMRIRLSSLRDHLGWATNPLSNPELIPSRLWENHWCARVGRMLHTHDATLPDTTGYHTLPNSRFKDVPIQLAVPSIALASSRANRLKHPIHWLGQLTNPDGTRLVPNPQFARNQTIWWGLLRRALCRPNSLHLIAPISPDTSPLRHFTPTHSPGTIVTGPTENLETGDWNPPSHNVYYKVTDSYMEDGRESCRVIPLHPCTTPIASIFKEINRKPTYQKVVDHIGTPYFKDDRLSSHTTEFADLIFPVSCTWLRAKPRGRDPGLDIALIHDTCAITAIRIGTIPGTTTPETIAQSVQTVRNRMDAITGKYNPPHTPTTSSCDLCSHPDTDTCCSNQPCPHRVHKRCLPNPDTWTCSECSAPTAPRPLTPDQISLLFDRSLSHTIYSASDGSVRGANTQSPSSTFGVCIDPSHLNITSGGKITIRMGEESSLRAELEALIHAYTIIPAGIDVIHAVDNMTAIDIHSMLQTSGLPPSRSLINKHYHSSIARLHTAMITRGTPLSIIHTLSHLEHTVSKSPSLKGRRDALANADNTADRHHSSEPIPHDRTGDEPYPLTIHGEVVEKKSKTPFPTIQMRLRRDLLYTKKMEGANHRTGASPGWATGSKHWPTHLTTFRHKLITMRLPNAHNRSARQDTENGTIVNPWCPRCLDDGVMTTETTEHQLYTCPHVQSNHLQLARTINNQFRTCSNPTPCHPPISEEALDRLIYASNIEWESTPGWVSSTSDKHGRETVVSRGPPGTQWEKMKLLTSWAHSILRYCSTHPHIEDAREYINSISLGDSIDPFLLQGIATAINAETIHSIIPHNPFMTTQSLCSTTPSEGTTPIVLSAVGQELEWGHILKHLSPDRPWVLLATDDQKDDIAPYIQQPIFKTLPADSIVMWKYTDVSYWSVS